ncbi:T-complex protein 1 subunit gamma isoform 1 [Tropilaelaps mercedesae]|uniref:T-complex protein 1 subunit gamma n=1 Tax=Tropilaelaps mercedesae TaxID=418985 RepID=A0A1V9XRS6_9ACAR|nr:T-complex protein 1 subunit gamma isoform 1 [Tropilaelaps mercedesae]
MFGPGQMPIVVLNPNTKRDSGRKVQLDNVRAAKAVADVVRTCLGPRAMLKMLMNPIGGIVMTNDGNAILRDIQVQHPAAKSMIEISRTQDEEVGDGTTSVIVLAGELLASAVPFLEQNMHPTIVIAAYRQALEDAVDILKNKVAEPVDVDDTAQMTEVINSCIGTKFLSKWSDQACAMALKAVKTVCIDRHGSKDIDTKNYVKVEKVPGGSIEESVVLDGVLLNKDVLHPRMRRLIEKPRIVLLDCNLEYKKGESQTNIEISNETDFSKILEIEENYIQQMCADIISVKPDLVITEKGVSDLAQHYLMQANVSVIRRVRKTDNNRIARVCGATICNRTDELKAEDVGTRCGRFEVKKIGDEYFSFLTECDQPKACTILLRGASKDILNEIERNLQDALAVTRNITLDPKVVYGGGAVEMAVGYELEQRAKSIHGVAQWPYRAVAKALEVIPATLIQNCGGNPIRTLTQLRAKHATGDHSFAINGETGEVVKTSELKVVEPLAVKLQAYKTAIETAILLLRIDDIVSGSKKANTLDGNEPTQKQVTEESTKE